jgi:hypothetical protein
MEEYVNDCKIHVFEVAWLTDEQVQMFRSDFKVVANFFVNKRRNKDYQPDDKTEIQHVDEVLKLLSVMAEDKRYESILADKKEVRNMCEVAQRLEDRGRAEGRAEGISKGENILVSLYQRLKSLGRDEDAELAMMDETARKQFYREFGMIGDEI